MNTITQHLERILDLARWAPSGDNTQPWRFEILNDSHLLVHGFDTREHCVYDLDGHPSQIAVGALLETISIAATACGLRTTIVRRHDTLETHLLFDVYFRAEANISPDPLVPYIETRVVQRRPMSIQSLNAEQKQTLTGSLPDGYSVIWYEGFAQRWRLAKFMSDNAKIRLTIPEAYEVHKSVIEWGAQFSTDKIPGQAVGVDPLTARCMRWVMTSWARVEFFNTYLFGHLPPRIQLDLLPGLCCGAHFALLAPSPLTCLDDYVAAGRVMQRFWLTATRLGWLIQPEMTPVIFTRYHRQGLAFTQTQTALVQAGHLNERLMEIVGAGQVEKVFFMGRIGSGTVPLSRSTRKKTDLLLIGS